MKIKFLEKGQRKKRSGKQDDGCSNLLVTGIILLLQFQ